jgi:hypothetical protein
MGNRFGTMQTIAYDGNVQATNVFGPGTFRVMLVSTSGCNVAIGDGTQTASQTTSMFVPANYPVIVDVTPGQRIAAIKAATNGLITATAGTLYVNELV